MPRQAKSAGKRKTGNDKAEGSDPKKSRLSNSIAQDSTQDSTSSNVEGAIFFYGTSTDAYYNFFSQHFLCTFTAPSPIEGNADLTFQSTEQYMMYHKAILFNDIEVAKYIMDTADPKSQKALGRQVSGFIDKVWNTKRRSIVEEGNWNKFNNSTEPWLKQKLLETGDRELVEVSEAEFDRHEADPNVFRHHHVIEFGESDLEKQTPKPTGQSGA
jgi:ribA/ribD-fused uncharacterized protein